MKWIKKRWLEFRTGHNLYMIVPLSTVNFILISYNFLFKGLLPLWQFILVFVVIYPLMTVALGKFHFKYQQETDVEMQLGKVLKEIRDLKEEMIK